MKVGCFRGGRESKKPPRFLKAETGEEGAWISYTNMGTLQRRRLKATRCMRDYVSVGLHLGRGKWLFGLGLGNGGVLVRKVHPATFSVETHDIDGGKEAMLPTSCEVRK